MMMFTTAWLARLKALFGITKYQRKVLVTPVAATGPVSELNFNSLTIGRTYRLTLRSQISRSAGADVSLSATCGADSVSTVHFESTSAFGTQNFTQEATAIIQASATTITVSASIGGTGSILAGSSLTVEEPPNHIPTTDWT